MFKKQKENLKNNLYSINPKHLKIKGSKSRYNFSGLLLLVIVTFSLFWVYNNIQVNSEEVMETPVETPGTTPNPLPLDPSFLESSSLASHEDWSYGKYEFRGAWLASIDNLDFPKAKELTTEELKSSFLKVLDVYQLYNLNTLIMQVRPEGDALYLSQLNPPSPYVIGDKGHALPFDLLKFAIEETHKRGLEFHAWFNPYRVTSKSSENNTEVILDTLHPLHYARLHPSQVLSFENTLFLDPGHPAVQEFVHQSIMEVVRNYDIDGVHLDDYFYPYPTQDVDEEGLPFYRYFGDNSEDLATFEKYSRGFTDIRAWRRDNTYHLIKNLSHDIHDLKPYVQLGISPFGIWGHKEETNGLGSNTPITSQETYNHSVFSDSRQWIKEELVDYVIPQLYWTNEEAQAPYEELAQWWNDVVEGTKVNLYIGHGLHKVYNRLEESWRTGTPILDQINFNKTLPNVKGSAFFRFSFLAPRRPDFSGLGQKHLEDNLEILKETYALRALVPKNKNLTTGKISPPREVSLTEDYLSFTDGYEDFSEEGLTKSFIIYQFPKDDLNCENPAYIFKRIVVQPGKTNYRLNFLDPDTYIYGVSAINRLQEESEVILANFN